MVFSAGKMTEVRERLLERFEPHLVCGPQTDLVIEGFPRSANSYTVRMLQALQPDTPKLRLAHHTHAIDNIKLALHHGKPVVVLSRLPEEAILSLAVYSGGDVEQITKHYRRFVTDILSLPKRPMMIDFAEVIHDFGYVLRRINGLIARYGVAPIPEPTPEQMQALTEKMLREPPRNAAEAHGARITEQMGLPSEARRKAKDERRAEVRACLERDTGIDVLYRRLLRQSL